MSNIRLVIVYVLSLLVVVPWLQAVNGVIIADESSARIEPFYPVTEEGSDMTIRCYSPADYQLQYSDIKFEIQHDGHSIRGPEIPNGVTDKFSYFTFTKSSIQAVDEGNYTCVITASKSGDMPSVDVYAHSYVRVMKLKSDTQPVIDKVRSDARFNCISEPSSQDELLVRWKVRGKLVENTEKYHITDDHTLQTLVVKNVVKEDADASYECEVAARSAEKYYGSFDNATKSKATMTVRRHLIVVEIKTTSRSISCHVYGTMEANVTWTDNNGTLLNATDSNNGTVSTVEVNTSSVVTLHLQVNGTQWITNSSDILYNTAALPDSGGLSQGAIAGIVTGVIVTVAAAVAGIVIFVVWRKKRAMTENHTGPTGPKLQGNSDIYAQVQKPKKKEGKAQQADEHAESMKLTAQDKGPEKPPRVTTDNGHPDANDSRDMLLE